MNLKTLIYNHVNLLGGSLPAMIKESTDIIFDLVKNPNKTDLYFTKKITELKWGKFYLIKYNFNGNKLWCPIFIIPPPINEQYHPSVAYAINIGLIPYKQRIELFNFIYSKFKPIVDYNDSVDNILKEKNLKEITFEAVYRIMQSMAGGVQFSITGFNMMKIEEIYIVSTKIIHRFVMVDVNKANRYEMKSLYDKMDKSPKRDRLSEILDAYSKILEEYREDNIEFYKKLKSLESNFKLFED
jgi:hypothetical protein